MSYFEHLQRGELLYQQGRHELAAKEFHAAAMEDATDSIAPAMLALSLLSINKIKEAVPAAREAVRRGPDHAFSHVALGYANWSRGQVTLAHQNAEEALRIDPFLNEALLLLGQLAKGRNLWKAVLDWTERGLRNDPRDDRMGILRASAQMELGQCNEAVSLLKQVLHRAPENADAHRMMGQALLRTGQEMEALPHLKEALRLDPNSEESRLHLLESLRTRNTFYRTLHRMSLWFKGTHKIFPAILIIASVFYIGLAIAIRGNTGVQMLLVPALLLVLFAMFRALGRALFDLVLSFDPYGRLLLTTSQTWCARGVGGLFVSGFVALLLAPFAVSLLWYALPALTVALYLISVHVLGRPEDHYYAIRLFYLGIVGVGQLTLLITALVWRFTDSVVYTDFAWKAALVVLVMYGVGLWHHFMGESY